MDRQISQCNLSKESRKDVYLALLNILIKELQEFNVDETKCCFPYLKKPFWTAIFVNKSARGSHQHSKSQRKWLKLAKVLRRQR